MCIVNILAAPVNEDRGIISGKLGDYTGVVMHQMQSFLFVNGLLLGLSIIYARPDLEIIENEIKYVGYDLSKGCVRIAFNIILSNCGHFGLIKEDKEKFLVKGQKYPNTSSKT